jgi:hypothetical protein
VLRTEREQPSRDEATAGTSTFPGFKSRLAPAVLIGGFAVMPLWLGFLAWLPYELVTSLLNPGH